MWLAVSVDPPDKHISDQVAPQTAPKVADRDANARLIDGPLHRRHHDCQHTLDPTWHQQWRSPGHIHGYNLQRRPTSWI